MGIANSKTKQNLVVFMEPSEDGYQIDMQAGNMILNRFCIDEDAAFELSGVNYLEKPCQSIAHGKNLELKEKRIAKGKEYSIL